MIEDRFKPFEEKMAAAGLDGLAVSNFRRYFDQLVSGETGLITGEKIEPVMDIPQLEDLSDFSEAGRTALKETVVIKLNGGLGTSMGMEKAKSLLPVKNGLSFLEIILHQIMTLREREAVRLPLILMNSVNTRRDSRNIIDRFPGMRQDIPFDFVQSRVPKIRQRDYLPVTYPDNPSLEWCPPGHGDIYCAMMTSGILGQLLEKGYRYAFVSNADNLGAVVETGILGYFAHQKCPFLMEVARRTPADRKGGHLARKKTGGLMLREVAQCPEQEISQFQDIDRFLYFNTNTIWLNLDALNAFLTANNAIVSLPLIRNAKTVNPKDPDSEPVYQLETAMGSALTLFPGAEAIHVPRNRFLPVKTCQDLLGLWSDAYRLDESYHVIRSRPDRESVICRLDPNHYRLIDQLMEKFPAGAPSLVDCKRFTVEGNVVFGRDIVLRGDVTIRGNDETAGTLPDGTRAEDEVITLD